MSETYVTVTGNIATRPVLRQVRDGVPFLTFRMAQNVNRLDRETGVVQTVATNWLSVAAFRAQAINLYRSLAKGQPVIVHGRLRIQEWESADRRGTSVEVEAVAIGHDLARGQACFTKVAAPPMPTVGDGPKERQALLAQVLAQCGELPESSLPEFITPTAASPSAQSALDSKAVGGGGTQVTPSAAGQRTVSAK